MRWNNTVVDNPGKRLNIINIEKSYEVKSPWVLGHGWMKSGEEMVSREKINIFYLGYIPEHVEGMPRIIINNDMPFWDMVGESWKRLKKRARRYSEKFDLITDVSDKDLEETRDRASGRWLDAGR